MHDEQENAPDVDVRNGREMVAGLDRNWRLIDEKNPHRMRG